MHLNTPPAIRGNEPSEPSKRGLGRGPGERGPRQLGNAGWTQGRGLGFWMEPPASAQADLLSPGWESRSDTEFGTESSQKRWWRQWAQRLLRSRICVSHRPQSLQRSPLVLPRAPNLINNENQRSKFKELIGFIQNFMNWAAPHLANRKALHWAAEGERFLKVEWGKKKELINKECFVSGKFTLLRGVLGVCGRGLLSSTEQRIPGWVVKPCDSPARDWNGT